METKGNNVSAQNLKCPVCMSIFQEPKILSCSHTFCQGCLYQLQESQVEIGKLPCPVCRQITDIPEGGVSQLQANTAMKALVEDAKKQACSNCKSDENEAEVFCKDCELYLCSGCHKNHSQWTAFSEHVVVDVADISSGEPVVNRRRKCKKHQSETQDYYCTDCRKYVCFRCRVDELHVREGHIILMLNTEEHEENFKRKIEGLKTMAENKIMSTNKFIGIIDTHKDRLNTMAKRLEGRVIEAFEEAVQQLTQMKQFLQNRIRNKFQGLETELNKIGEPYHQRVTNIRAIKELIGDGLRVPIEQECLRAHDMLCDQLQALLEMEDPDYDKPLNLVRKGERMSFERNNGEEIGLGRVEESDWDCVQIELPLKDSMQCLSAMPDGRMAVGCNPGGINIFSRDGRLLETVLAEESITEVAFLSDGQYVVCDENNSLSVYTADCQKSQTLIGEDQIECGGLTVDNDDVVYVSNTGDDRIQVFNLHDEDQSQKEIVCRNMYEPMHILALNSSSTTILVTSCSDNFARVIDDYGDLKYKVTKGPGRVGYPATCQDGSILIAWVKHEEGLVTIDRYSRELMLVETLITDREIEKPGKMRYYLHEFVSGEIVFGTPDRVYLFYYIGCDHKLKIHKATR